MTRGPCRRGARNVKEQVVLQLEWRGLRVTLLARFLQPAQLAVDLAEQALDGHPRVEPALTQRLDHCADHPPELEHRLAGRGGLELFRDLGHGRKLLLRRLAAYPAEQCSLEARPQALRHLREVPRRAGRDRVRRLVGLEVQHQECALGEQRPAAHGPQVVQQRQQCERHVPPAGGNAVEVGRQLLHRAHQRIEPVGVRLALAGVHGAVLRDQFHFLGEQRGAVDLGDAQRPPAQVQVPGEAIEQAALLRSLGVGLERDARLVELRGDLAGDELQRGVRLVGRTELHGHAAHLAPCDVAQTPSPPTRRGRLEFVAEVSSGGRTG